MQAIKILTQCTAYPKKDWAELMSLVALLEVLTTKEVKALIFKKIIMKGEDQNVTIDSWFNYIQSKKRYLVPSRLYFQWDALLRA